MNLTERDLKIARLLTLAIRVTAEDQFLDAYWPGTAAGRKNGQRRLRAICREQLLESRVVHVRAVRRVQLLCAGGPDTPVPDCAELSRQSRSAWNALPIRPTVIYLPTRRARLVFGGHERHRVHALPQLSHDLGVSASYFDLLRTETQLAAAWRSEDDGLLPDGFGDCQPDGVLVDADERPTAAIEFAACYAPQRFERLLQTFQEQQLSYRIYGAQP